MKLVIIALVLIAVALAYCAGRRDAYGDVINYIDELINVKESGGNND